jgi:lipoprotein Spr
VSQVHIPSSFWFVRYDGRRVPDRRNDLSDGANCQRFAYAVLAANGVELPPFRSSNLWEDEEYTYRPGDVRPLDLLLFHGRAQAWGAHVAVAVGPDSAVHLAKLVGHPVVWPLNHFALNDRYRCFIGAKRVRTADSGQ